MFKHQIRSVGFRALEARESLLGSPSHGFQHQGSNEQKKDTDADGPSNDTMLVGMVTDAGTIDDKSFNQGTWEGIIAAEADMDIATKYLKPGGTTEADYLREIGNLYDAGYKFWDWIVATFLEEGL